MTAFNFCSLKKAAPFFLFLASLLFGIQKACSQTDYSAILSGSNWNVPLENQLAYGAPSAKYQESHLRVVFSFFSSFP
jgi:hypothetical protein